MKIMNDSIQTSIGLLKIDALLGKGKSGYSYLVELGDQKFIYKQMHNEPCFYYDFKIGKLDAEIIAYETLQKTGIKIPKLICYDKKKDFLIKEYIEGPTASQAIAKNIIDETTLFSLIDMFIKLKNSNLNIDYFPSNFVLKNQQLYYIDYEVNPYSEEWDLFNWGIFYWFNNEGFDKFLSTNDSTYINSSIDSAKPIKDPFLEKFNTILSKYYSLKTD